MSERGGGRGGLRRALAAVMVFDVFLLGWHHFFEPPMPEQAPYWPWVFVWLHHQPALLVGLSALALAAIGAFALRRRELLAGFVALLCVGLLNEAYAAVVDGPRRMFFSAGAALFGWLAGLIVARARDADEERAERLAEAGAMGALAATYVSAGLQKVFHGALFESTSLRAHIFTHHPVDDTSLLGGLAYTVASEPWLSATLSAGVVVIQLGAWLWLAGPRVRVVWGTLLISFHVGTLVLLDIIYVEATFLLIAFTYPWHRLRGVTAAVDVARIDRAVAVRAGWAAATFVAIAWVIPTPGELEQATHRPPPGPDEPAPAPAENLGLTTIGPIDIGDEVGGWRVVHLRRDPDEAVVSLERGEHGVRFGFRERREGDLPSPYDHGTLHVYVHHTELGEDAFDEAGRELTRRLSQALASEPAGLRRWLSGASSASW